MSDFDSFKSQFTGDLVTPTDPDYVFAIARWAANAQRRAKIIAFVRTAEDVVLAIAYARANQLEIAIRGGGHNPSGASSTEGGLVIDLSRYINGARVDEDNRLAYVGGGALWKTVDTEAIKFGLATVAGTVNHTGVGGLTLGGGYGWLSARHGLTLDNLVQATIVTASGSILTTNASSHPNLFFGIRGGGSNFGVVTEFVYRLHPQRRSVYAGTLSFAESALENLVNLTREWWPNVGEDEGMLQAITVGAGGEPIIILVLFYNGSEEEGRRNFQKFFDIGPIADQTREMPYEELNSLLNAIHPHGRCSYMKGLTQEVPDYPSTLAAHKHIVDIYNRSSETSVTTAKAARFSCPIIFEYLPLGKINSVPRGETAFFRDTRPEVMLNLSWDPNTAPGTDIGEEEQDNVKQARAYAVELAEIIASGQRQEAVSQVGYTNHDSEAGRGKQEAGVVESKARIAFGENYRRLQEVKKAYDPDGVFNKWFPITAA